MQTLLEILKKSQAYLEGRGVPNPKLDAELLLAHGLNCKRLDLFLRFEEVIHGDSLDHLRALIQRRGKREPLQHIIGTVPFHDIVLGSDPRALIPRPETEYLVDLIINAYQSTPPERILDLGTGSGVIALSLAHAFPEASVTAVDIAPQALSLAQENEQRVFSEPRVTWIESSWLDKVKGRFDLIISNPPYLTQAEWDTAEDEVKAFDPFNALVAPDGGLADLKHILEQATHYLNNPAALYLESGIAQHDTLIQLATQLGYTELHSIADLSGRPRFISAQWQC